MAVYQTTMKALLTNIKNRIMDYRATTLSGVRLYKRGVLSPLAQFPAIAILPDFERKGKKFSGGKVHMHRGVRLEVYTKKGLSTKKALEQGMDIIEALKDIIQAEYDWQDDDGDHTCFDTVIQKESFGEGVPYKSKFLQLNILPMVCWSKEVYPTRTVERDLQEESGKDFLTTVFDTVKADSDLSSVKKWYKSTVPNIPIFPAVTMTENTEDFQRYEAGREQMPRQIETCVFTKLYDKETALNHNLTIMEDLKNVLRKTPQWSGYAKWSEITDIDFGIYARPGMTMMYSTRILMDCYAKEVLSF